MVALKNTDSCPVSRFWLKVKKWKKVNCNESQKVFFFKSMIKNNQILLLPYILIIAPIDVVSSSYHIVIIVT